VSAPQKKAAVGHLVEAQKCSQRQACRFIGLSRSSARYQARDRVDEAELVERLQKFAGRRRRRGYRLAHRELRRDGFAVNHKRVYRLWKGAGLSVPPRKTRKRIRGPVAPRPVTALRPNGVWCIDFLEEKTFSGAKLRILCVSDEFTRESLAIETSRSFRSERVCRVLQELIRKRGAPGALRMDNGPQSSLHWPYAVCATALESMPATLNRANHGTGYPVGGVLLKAFMRGCATNYWMVRCSFR